MRPLAVMASVVSGFLLGGRLKVSLQYEHRWEWFDTQVDNDFLAIQIQGRI